MYTHYREMYKKDGHKNQNSVYIQASRGMGQWKDTQEISTIAVKFSCGIRSKLLQFTKTL